MWVIMRRLWRSLRAHIESSSSCKTGRSVMVAEEDIDIGEIVAEYGLACHLEELDEVGLTVVDQDTLRLPMLG